MNKDRIEYLEEAHKQLDKQITNLQKNKNLDDLKISELKKKKLLLKDEIFRLRHLDYKDSHERVDFNEHR